MTNRSTCPSPVDRGDGRCSSCERPLASYIRLGRIQVEHKRGRYREAGTGLRFGEGRRHRTKAEREQVIRDRRIQAIARAELDPETWCECGQKLRGHPPLPKPKPWEAGRPCGRPTPARYSEAPSPW